MTNYSSTNGRLTIISYLFRANVVDLQPMGGRIDKVKVYLICMKRVQKVDERGQNVLQKLR